MRFAGKCPKHVKILRERLRHEGQQRSEAAATSFAAEKEVVLTQMKRAARRVEVEEALTRMHHLGMRPSHRHMIPALRNMAVLAGRTYDPQATAILVHHFAAGNGENRLMAEANGSPICTLLHIVSHVARCMPAVKLNRLLLRTAGVSVERFLSICSRHLARPRVVATLSEGNVLRALEAVSYLAKNAGERSIIAPFLETAMKITAFARKFQNRDATVLCTAKYTPTFTAAVVGALERLSHYPPEYFEGLIALVLYNATGKKSPYLRDVRLPQLINFTSSFGQYYLKCDDPAKQRVSLCMDMLAHKMVKEELCDQGIFVIRRIAVAAHSVCLKNVALAEAIADNIVLSAAGSEEDEEDLADSLVANLNPSKIAQIPDQVDLALLEYLLWCNTVLPQSKSVVSAIGAVCVRFMAKCSKKEMPQNIAGEVCRMYCVVERGGAPGALTALVKQVVNVVKVNQLRLFSTGLLSLLPILQACLALKINEPEYFDIMCTAVECRLPEVPSLTHLKELSSVLAALRIEHPLVGLVARQIHIMEHPEPYPGECIVLPQERHLFWAAPVEAFYV